MSEDIGAQDQKSTPVRVFISYSHDSPEHEQRVLELAFRLRTNGIDARLDQGDSDPPEGWRLWMEKQVEKADFVLMVCTQTYKNRCERKEMSGKGQGVRYESVLLLDDLYENDMLNEHLVPCGFSPGARKFVPKSLRQFNFYPVDSDEGYEALLRKLTGQKKVVLPPLGSVPELHSEDVAPLSFGKKVPKRARHNLPFLPLGALLKGREKGLADLEKALARKGAVAINQPHTLYGLGGVGKTRLAVEYAWRHMEAYDFVLYVKAEDPALMRQSLAELAGPGLLDLPERQAQEEGVVVAAVLANLSQTNGLMILDNVDSDEAAAAVIPLLSQLTNSRVVVTSRRQNWPQGIATQEIRELGPDEATSYLLEAAEDRRRKEHNDAEAARTLASELAGLPLALELAAAFIRRQRESFASYLGHWTVERTKVLEWHDGAQTQYPTSVAATWRSTFDVLTPGAKALLRLTSFFAPEAIPEWVFERTLAVTAQATLSAATECSVETPDEKLDLAGHLSELEGYSMIKRRDGALAVHRLVQEVVRLYLPKGRAVTWLSYSLEVLSQVRPQEATDFRTWKEWEALQSHIAQACAQGVAMGIPSPTARLLDRLATFFQWKGRVGKAEPLFALAVDLLRPLKSEDDFYYTCLGNHALALRELDRFSEAEPKIREALVYAEKNQNLSIISARLSNFASLLEATGRLEQAEILMERALEIAEEIFGPNNPEVAVRLNNLAHLLVQTNRLKKAEALVRRAHDIDEASVGPDHPRIAIRLSNLAQILRRTNRIKEAENALRQALRIDEYALGARHPNVATDLNNLALLLQDTNRTEEAEPLASRAVEIMEASLGPDHPDTPIAQNTLTAIRAQLASEPPD